MAEYIEYLPVFGAIHDLSMDAFRRNDRKELCCYNKALSILCNAPAADVAPVIHGRWEFIGDDYANCTNCGRVFDTRPTPYFFQMNNPFCRKCGARMDGE